MVERNIKQLVDKALSRSPVVLLNGARQVGKTTLALEFQFSHGYTYITFDDEIVYFAAKNDPVGFIHSLSKPVIIDEVQRVPEIFLAIKRDVDGNRVAGRYLLTGSANALLIPRLGDSLAGRMEVITLLPLSQGELVGRRDDFLTTVFSDTPLKHPAQSLSRVALYEKIIRGGYPSVQKIDDEDRRAWMRNYLNLILQRDIKDLANIEKIAELPNLLRLLAARSANLVNVADIARDSRLVAKTLHRYIVLLETIFLITFLPSWATNLTVRLTKSPKVYLIDPGLLAYLLGIDNEKAASDTPEIGKLLENFVVSELQKQATWSKKHITMYHFRSSSGEEVDLILEDERGYVVAIEVKHSLRVTAADFKGMRYLKDKIGKRFIKGIVFYPGDQIVPFEADLFAVPLSVLWQ